MSLRFVSREKDFLITYVMAPNCVTLVVRFDKEGTKETSVLSNQDFIEYIDLKSMNNIAKDRLEASREEIAEKAKRLYSKETMARSYMKEYDRDGRKERVLLIDVNCKNSSTGKIVYDLYSSLRKDGRSAAICYGRGPFVEEENIYKFGLDWETNIHAGLARVTGYNGFFSPLSTRRLIEYIEQYKPDLIHIHELHAYFVNIKPLINFIKEKKIPLIWTFHCEYMYTGKCGHAYECSGFRGECGNCPAVHDYPKSLFFDKTKQMLRMKKELLQDLDFTIVTPSQWLADRVRLSFLKEKDIKVIHNGVDTDIFHPCKNKDLRNELGIGETDKVALFVSPIVMDVRKGGQWVMKISKEMPDWTFLMIGGGETHHNAPKNVRFIGSILDKHLLAKYYSAADVFLLCSEKETYSMTCAEALCCGTPVVGFKAGAPETVFQGLYARFVEYGDIQGMVKAINESIKV